MNGDINDLQDLGMPRKNHSPMILQAYLGQSSEVEWQASFREMLNNCPSFINAKGFYSATSAIETSWRKLYEW